jgi:hypothetical protein
LAKTPLYLSNYFDSAVARLIQINCRGHFRLYFSAWTLRRQAMPIETIYFVAGTIAAFTIFALALAYASYTSGN